MTFSHRWYLEKYLTRHIRENIAYWYQCVAMNKHYAREVQWVKLWWFNGSAIKATYKIGWTYNPTIRKELNPWPWVDLVRGDHLIQDFWPHWHIGIVHRVDDEWYFLLAQNDWEYHKNTRWNGDWQGNNSIMIRYFRWSDRKIHRIYRLR